MREIDVFFSYYHADRERVRPLVDEVRRHGWAVWWDTEMRIGSQWREVLDDCLNHARAVCVIWTVRSVGSQFVRDEAARANRRGILVPVRLDPVDQPLGFGEIQCADLSGPDGPAGGMRKVITSLGRLVDGAAPVSWRPYGLETGGAVLGVAQARRYLDRVRARSHMFAANPGAAAGLRSALAGVRDTYAVLGESIDAFLAPAMEHGDLTLDRYRPLADGRLVTDISRRRGHCKQIAQVYIQSGGLRDSLSAGLSPDVKDELDHLILIVSSADVDLFDQMASMGTTIQNQSAILINLLLAGQEREAHVRVRDAENVLLPLRQEISEGMAEVERLSAELGVPV